MSDEGSESQNPQDGVIWWWDGQEYKRISPEMLDPATSDVALAISQDEYPELADLLTYGANGAAYLQSLGIEMDDDNPMGMGTVGSPVPS